MMSTIVGGIVNAVLDPILIFGLDLELTGAALASAISRFAIAAYALAPIIRADVRTSAPRSVAAASKIRRARRRSHPGPHPYASD